ncbi:MAG TPA: NAD(P)/FAD-dependent oxidoreductase [bacterium]|nr:NAD(P)/FAD-dependent oxidoreductase [bacterium]
MIDVVVAGGGPAGAVCAARLARLGRSVVVLEKEHHPRFHLGESLLPNSLAVLADAGVLEEVRKRFLVKRGARFVDGADSTRTSRYAFADAFHVRWDHAFQVPRDEFDELLFRHAGRCGAEVREGWTARRVLRDERSDRATGLEVTDPDGRSHTLEARFVVDATGRAALTARAADDVQRIAHLDRTAVYTQFRGAWRDTGERDGDIQIVVFGEGDARGWFWLIPFADGRTSVGAVVSSAWVRDHRGEGADAGEQLLRAAVAEAPSVASMLSNATQLFPAGCTADFSFRVRRLRGPGWAVLGDAGGFIDPLFSTGVHLALTSAWSGAAAVDAALSGGDEPALFDAWERDLRRGADLFLGAVQAFYGGDLTSYLFASPQHPFLRRAITSLLAGDVFDAEARWAGEMRSRFPARA